ncbi:MAG: three-Cys-motif partner protein TcmP [Actinobacteria bacterium]|nr:three-Cys-motif partner protein TcmP [Actinomycetota bacterium]MCG2819131.1 three-Cys-motif partner protein TcmP [Actinomycetes bacterium]MBU4218738.1 three-Cys-motif partner protein TcmP [Actinomycetota bacterium]MBU4359467.1 three-Cys-motif partner protein TcmP [Actinomycetota bacterium]MBU4391338.1 three-Cys-motif partner protein TcmP [Actinomycetota bacterium]
MSYSEQFDEIGYWSEMKIEIISDYLKEYSKIVSAQDRFDHYYIDAFSGSGQHRSKTTGELVQGSPLRVLDIKPEFKEYFFIDLNPVKAENLRRECAGKENVHVFPGDCNEVLLRQIFPQITWEGYKRAFCLLDPYGMHYKWEVVEKAARMKTIEVILNFPTMDMNMNALWKNPEGLPESQIQRMDAFRGDDSWQKAFYQTTLFDNMPGKAADNKQVVDAYVERLKKKAGFEYVTAGFPVKAQNRDLYYLVFAGPNEKGKNIAEYIFNKYRSRGAI